MQSALQELDETAYWIELAIEAAMTDQSAERLLLEADELTRIFVASIKTAKRP